MVRPGAPSAHLPQEESGSDVKSAPTVTPEHTQVSIDAKDRLIVALDLHTVEAAQEMVNDLEGVVDFFKIGLALQLAEGVGNFIRSLIKTRAKRVFLDYKYYDISETLKKAVSRAAGLGVAFLTVHGSSVLIKAAVEGRGSTNLKLFTVTVLTSLDAT